MNLRRNMANAFSPKALCITLILLMSIGFSFAGAQANNCEGGAGCLICALQPHRHLPGKQTSVENPGCSPYETGSTCGFEAGQDSEKFYGIASAVGSICPARTGIFTGALNENDQFRVSRGLIASSFPSEPCLKAPIYLRNHSLLC
jgi:hypothetical protein